MQADPAPLTPMAVDAALVNQPESNKGDSIHRLANNLSNLLPESEDSASSNGDDSFSESINNTNTCIEKQRA